MRIGIIAALPGELKPLVKGWERLPVAKGSGVRMWQRPASEGEDEVVAVCAGMGAVAARKAFVAAEFGGALDAVWSVGWAGATVKNFLPESCWVVSQVIDAQTGERFECKLQGEMKLRLVTATHVAGAEEKRRLWHSYQAGMVDMEAATVARLATMREIPFYCVKAISDDVDAELPDLNAFLDADGQLQMGRFVAYVAVRPGYWPALARLGMHSAVAAKKLARTVVAVLAGSDVKTMQRRGLAGG